MATQRLGIIMHGVTGRMGMNQHLIRSICAIRAQGGVTLSNGDKVMPDPILVGRNAEKMEALAQKHGIARWGTDLDAALANGATLIDVRSAAEYATGGIPGSINVPLDDLRARLDDLPAGPLIVHCQVGQRGHTAARLLAQAGREVRNLDGGYLTWRDGARMSGQEQR